MKKEITEQEAYLKLAATCAQAEHCQQEMRDKLAFVKDKIRYNKWGRRKVQQGLWLKRIDPEIQQHVLDEINDNEYLDVLRLLLRQKRKIIKASNDYELNQKLARFALGRGFSFDIIRQCLDVDEDDFETEL